MDRAKLSAQPSLYKRGERFYAKIKHADGRWTNHNTGQQVRQHALVAAEEMQARVDRGLPAVDKPDASGTAHTPAALLTVRELAQRFLADYTGRVKNIDAYRQTFLYDLKYLIFPYLGELRASMLRRTDIKAYLARLRQEEYSPGTLRVAVGRLSILYTWAITEEIIDMAHPCKGLCVGKKVPASDFYTLDEIGRLLALADTPELDGTAVMVVAGLYSGMRRGELRALRWSWVDLDRLAIEVRASYRGLPKNGKPRTIPLHKELLPWLLRWRDQCPATPEGLLFPAPVHDPHGKVTAWRMGRMQDRSNLADLLKRAECHVPERPFHTFRHSLASHLSKATKGNNDVVSKILGHTPPGCAVTMGYIHTADLDYLAGELGKLSYLAKTPAKVLDLQAERDKRRQQAEQEQEARPATDLLPRALAGARKP